jgi:hypothetical protein
MLTCHPGDRGKAQNRMAIQADLDTKWDSHLQNNQGPKKAVGVAQAVEHLPNLTSMTPWVQTPGQPKNEIKEKKITGKD